METILDITLTAPFAVGDLVARVELAGGGAEQVVLRDGRFQGPVGGTPLRFTLTTEPAPAGEAPLAPATMDRPGEPAGVPVDVKDAFGEQGIAVPEDRRVAVQLAWGTPCHDEVPGAAHEGTRFGSWEHIMCAGLVGLDATGDALVCDGVNAWFTRDMPLRVGQSSLRFGDIIALAGDFYAHLDDAAAKDFAQAWPEATGLVGWSAGDYRATTLAGDAAENTAAILKVVFTSKDKPGSVAHEAQTVIADGIFGRYPARRYLALASQNHCHFGAQPSDGSIQDATNEALQLYRAYHGRAIAEAAAAAGAASSSAAFERALVTEAFGCHFLTDLFASGHIRVPRRVLGERHGVLQGSLSMAAKMHGEDNELGLWCARRVGRPGEARVVWRVYGDGAMRTPAAAVHLGQVQEAVRRSVAEVFAVYAAASVRNAPAGEVLAAIPPADRAEARLPVPLPAGEMPRAGDVLPDGTAAPQEQPNPWPRYWLLADGCLAERVGGTEQNRYMIRDAQGRATETVEIHARG